jgi:hypothetical protein
MLFDEYVFGTNILSKLFIQVIFGSNGGPFYRTAHQKAGTSKGDPTPTGPCDVCSASGKMVCHLFQLLASVVKTNTFSTGECISTLSSILVILTPQSGIYAGLEIR